MQGGEGRVRVGRRDPREERRVVATPGQDAIVGKGTEELAGDEVLHPHVGPRLAPAGDQDLLLGGAQGGVGNRGQGELQALPAFGANAVGAPTPAVRLQGGAGLVELEAGGAQVDVVGPAQLRADRARGRRRAVVEGAAQNRPHVDRGRQRRSQRRVVLPERALLVEADLLVGQPGDRLETGRPDPGRHLEVAFVELERDLDVARLERGQGRALGGEGLEHDLLQVGGVVEERQVGAAIGVAGVALEGVVVRRHGFQHAQGAGHHVGLRPVGVGCQLSAVDCGQPVPGHDGTEEERIGGIDRAEVDR